MFYIFPSTTWPTSQTLAGTFHLVAGSSAATWVGLALALWLLCPLAKPVVSAWLQAAVAIIFRWVVRISVTALLCALFWVKFSPLFPSFSAAKLLAWTPGLWASILWAVVIATLCGLGYSLRSLRNDMVSLQTGGHCEHPAQSAQVSALGDASAALKKVKESLNAEGNQLLEEALQSIFSKLEKSLQQKLKKVPKVVGQVAAVTAQAALSVATTTSTTPATAVAASVPADAPSASVETAITAPVSASQAETTPPPATSFVSAAKAAPTSTTGQPQPLQTQGGAMTAAADAQLNDAAWAQALEAAKDPTNTLSREVAIRLSEPELYNVLQERKRRSTPPPMQQNLSEEEKQIAKQSLAELGRLWRYQYSQRTNTPFSEKPFDAWDLGRLTNDECLLNRSEIRQLLHARRANYRVVEAAKRGSTRRNCETCHQWVSGNHRCYPTAWEKPGRGIGQIERTVVQQAGRGPITLRQVQVQDSATLQAEVRKLEALKKMAAEKLDLAKRIEALEAEAAGMEDDAKRQSGNIAAVSASSTSASFQ